MRDDLTKAYTDKDPLLIKEYTESLCAGWNRIIDCITEETIWTGDGSYVHEQIDGVFPHIDEIAATLLNDYPPRTSDVTIHMYVSLLAGAKTFGRHRDTADVFFIGGKGQTEFTIEGKSYIVEGGDLLYIPRSVYHDPKVLTPRVGFSIGLEHGRHDT